ncbi:hypothetical protein [Photobacterium sp. R1]
MKNQNKEDLECEKIRLEIQKIEVETVKIKEEIIFIKVKRKALIFTVSFAGVSAWIQLLRLLLKQ